MRKFVDNYDQIFSNKNYNKEVNLTISALKLKTGDRILEIGAGTGRHTIELLNKGIEVIAIEPDNDFLEKLKYRCSNFDKAKIISISIQKLQLEKSVNGACSLFNVINYITDDENLLMAFKNIHNALMDNSFFLFDCWSFEWALSALPEKIENRSFIDLSGEITTFTLKNRFSEDRKYSELTYQFSDGTIDATSLRIWSHNELRNLAHKAGFINFEILNKNELNKCINSNNWLLLKK